MKIIGMIILLIGCVILWQHFELKKFGLRPMSIRRIRLHRALILQW